MAYRSNYGRVGVFLCPPVRLTESTPRIHERSAREKISTDQVAHVLNDEVSRKYIQSLKRSIASNPTNFISQGLIDLSRLLTFSQTKYPPEDVTQLMG